MMLAEAWIAKEMTVSRTTFTSVFFYGLIASLISYNVVKCDCVKFDKWIDGNLRFSNSDKQYFFREEVGLHNLKLES